MMATLALSVSPSEPSRAEAPEPDAGLAAHVRATIER